MKILSLDTAMAACSAAVIDTDADRPLAEAFVPMERGHAEALAPMVAQVMAEAGISFEDVDRIAVTVGPGTFTGVRIGLALARGIGVARRLPVIGIDTLTAIAANDTADAPLLVVSDARNGEVYAAAYDASRRCVRKPHVTVLAEAARDMPAGSHVIGSAAQAAIAASGRSDLIMSNAGGLPVAARLAHRAAHATPDGMPSPLYLRAPDAKPQAARLRRAEALSFETVSEAGAPLLSSIHGEAFDAAWSPEAMADLLRMPGASAIMALEHGEPLGFVIMREAADEAEIITIATRPSAQRRSVARQLLDRQFTELLPHGVRQVFLEVAEGNTAARGLYAALGFHEAGRRKGYYKRPSGTEDAIVMRKDISA